MFSFVGDTVLDPFLGTGTTSVAAAKWGRNSIGVEVDPHYFQMAAKRVSHESQELFSSSVVRLHRSERVSGFPAPETSYPVLAIY